MNIYKSKVDTGLAATLLVFALVSLYVTWLLTQQPNPPLWFVMLITLFIGAVLPIWVLRSTHYVLENDNALLVASGPFRWTIPLSEIKEITPAHSYCYCPALSQDQLHIRYSDDKVVIISPQNRDLFLSDLKSRHPAAA